MVREFRFLSAAAGGLKLQQRADGDDGLPRISGTAAVYFRADDPEETQFQLWDDIFERIMPGAFDDAIDRDDVRALQNHDPRLLLGRSASGTLKLTLSKRGLEYEIDTADTTAGRDTVASLRRGDISGSSFAFKPTKVTWTEERDDDAGRTIHYRNIEGVQLFDVGPVTFPAYSGTDSGVRGVRSGITLMESRGDAAAELAAIREERDRLLLAPQRERAAAERDRVLRLLTV